MDACIRALREEVSQNPSLFHSRKYNTLPELLWFYHTQYYPVSSDSIRAHFNELEYILDTLSQKRQRKLLYCVYQLCEEHEKSAFLQGLRVGVQLLTELSPET